MDTSRTDLTSRAPTMQCSAKISEVYVEGLREMVSSDNAQNDDDDDAK